MRISRRPQPVHSYTPAFSKSGAGDCGKVSPAELDTLELTPFEEVFESEPPVGHIVSPDVAVLPGSKSPIPPFCSIEQQPTNSLAGELEGISGFPDTHEVSRRILTQVRTALKQAQSLTGIEVLFAGFDGECSVGKGRAIPGSDLDGLHVVVRSDQDKERFFATFSNLMAGEKRLGLIEAKTPKGAMLSLSDLERIKSERPQNARESGFLYWKLSRALHDRPDWTLLESKDFSRDALREKVSPLPVMDWERELFAGKMAPKPKYVAREKLAESYPSLSSPEKDVVARILMSDPDNEDMSFLDLTENNSTSDVLLSLEKRGLLQRFDPNDPLTRDAVTRFADATKNDDFWGEKCRQALSGPARMVARWKISHWDQPFFLERDKLSATD